MKTKGKIIILSAPSGTGKSSIISRLIKDESLRLGFSISATSRKPRGTEQNGREYYFLSEDEFNAKVGRGEFVEWEEVYPGTKYGTLESEVDRVTSEGKNLIMDIDVKGGINVKKRFGERALSIFILPPSIEELEKRLRGRATDSEEKILQRLEKAELELTFSPEYDVRVFNDQLERAVDETNKIIRDFIEEEISGKDKSGV